MKVSWAGIRTGRDHTCCHHRHNRTQLGEISLISWPSNEGRLIMYKAKSQKASFPHFSLPPGLNFNSEFSSSQRHRGTGMGSAVRLLHCLCSSFLLSGRTPHTFPLLQQGVSPTGQNLPQVSPVWVLPMGCSSSQTTWLWVPSKGCTSSGADCPSVGPLQCHKSFRKPALPWAPLSMWPKVLWQPPCPYSPVCSWPPSPQGTLLMKVVCYQHSTRTSCSCFLFHQLPAENRVQKLVFDELSKISARLFLQPV